MTRPFVILKMGSPVPGVAARRGEFDRFIIESAGLSPDEVLAVDVHLDAQLPPRDGVLGVIVSGSAAMVTDRAPWSVRAAAWLGDAIAEGVAVLGICYGHQLIADALGGEVHDNPSGRTIGTVDVELHDEGRVDPLFRGLAAVLHVPVSHVQSVIKLPPGARVLARSKHDPHYAYRVGHRAWGVQFHPEFDADIVLGYIEARREILLREGLDPDALARQVRASSHGPELLRRFVEIARAAI